MAYTAVPTLSTGYLVTAADWNAYVKDNFAAGVPDIFTTKGDLAVASAADAAGRLAVGVDGQVLTADSGETLGLKWAATGFAGTGAIAAAEADLAIATATVTIVRFDDVIYDPGSDVTEGAAWKYTAPSTGYYLVTAAVLFESSAAWGVNEYAYLAVYVDGALVKYLDRNYMEAAGTYNVFLCGSAIIPVNATQYIDVRVYQNSGSSINIDGAENPEHCHIGIMQLL